MKFFYIGSGVLLFLLVVSILCGLLISDCTKESITTLNAALEAVDRGDFETACALGVRANEEWDAHHKILSAFIGHNELDTIESGFIALSSYGHSGNEEEFRFHCMDLISQLKHVEQMDRPSYYNFFTKPCVFTQGLTIWVVGKYNTRTTAGIAGKNSLAAAGCRTAHKEGRP